MPDRLPPLGARACRHLPARAHFRPPPSPGTHSRSRTALVPDSPQPAASWNAPPAPASRTARTRKAAMQRRTSRNARTSARTGFMPDIPSRRMVRGSRRRLRALAVHYPSPVETDAPQAFLHVQRLRPMHHELDGVRRHVLMDGELRPMGLPRERASAVLPVPGLEIPVVVDDPPVAFWDDGTGRGTAGAAKDGFPEKRANRKPWRSAWPQWPIGCLAQRNPRMFQEIF